MSDNISKKAVLLVNLGTPEEATSGAVRRFLKEFLSDPRVVEVPRPIWWMILNLFILPFRPRSVAKNYQELWNHYGDSPLRIFSASQEKKLQQMFQQHSKDVLVSYAMTYGKPSIKDQLDHFRDLGIEKILVMPLYPQYSATTTAAVYDQICLYQKDSRDILDIDFCKSYYDHPAYQQALKQSVSAFWDEHGRSDKLVFSYHGIPKRNVDLGDPYREHCQQTTNKLVEDLDLAAHDYVLCFQSRLGKAEWLKPYTTESLKQLAVEGVKSVDVVCPSFAVDCLETLEEIAIENANEFKAAGGESLRLIPALNDSDVHIDALYQITAERLGV